MNEHDSTLASGDPGDREAGQSPPHQQESASAEGAQAAGAPAEPSTTAYPSTSYQGGSYSGGGGYAAPQAGDGGYAAPQAGAQPAYQASAYQAPTYQAPTYQAATDHVPASPYQAPGSPYQAPGSPYQAPGSPYQAPGSPYQAPGSSYQAPGSSYQAPGSPYAGEAEQGGAQPGTPYPGAPTWPPAGYGHDPRPAAKGGLGRVGVLGVAAIVLALVSGVTGGFIAHQFGGGGGTTINKTLTAAPAVDRASVAAVAAKVQPAVVDITTGSGEGSGVVISADGAILTNNHVIEGAQSGALQVTFNNGTTAKATVVGADPAGDLAVIKAQGVSNLTAAKFGDSDGMQVGDTVLALGSPLGLQGSVTAGIISALHRTIDEGGQDPASQRSIGDALQTDAAINPGNSGGALINLAGEVIGVNTAIATNGQGAGNIGVGFAISSNVAKSTADQLLKGGKVAHPFIGVQVATGDGGALLADVQSGGPADKAGLRKGDLVKKIGSRNIPDSKALVAAVKSAKPGEQLQMTIVRNGTEQQVTVTIGESN
jgi:putative serine protease PepD